ncbi:MAG TPA: zinc ribbon domain-containing protein [Ktedonobacteraceae bacterium]|jgi:hypothetical protein|nr:zinc ribbon domain-containing protein [Ktedonobacteraceae bacterium]
MMEQNYVVPNIYQDLSDQNQGYFAFRFVCQQCRWQIDTRATRSTISTVSNIADIGIGLIGGFWGRAAEAGQKIYGSQWHQEQADALQKAWGEIRHHFHFCPKCQETVCARCFNSQLGLCIRDAPDLRADGAQFKHDLNIGAQRQQIAQAYNPPQFNVNAIPSAATPEMLSTPQPPAQIPPYVNTPQLPQTPQSAQLTMVACPQCQLPGPAGKFCQDCGTKLPQAQPLCPGCGAPREAHARFCQECGYRLT